MSKDEIIQNLFDQIHSINDHYLAIMAIVLVLTAVAFSALMWLQIRLSKTQYEKMKSELLAELVEKYDLESVKSLSTSADRHIKMVLSRLTFRYALSKSEPMTKSEQSSFISQLVYIEESFRRDTVPEDVNDVGYMIWKICTELLASKNLKGPDALQIRELVEKTSEYKK